ncbi:MAG TPA: glycoside hydrolase [Herpetosiphon sp.]|uniref:Glycoside hydrolase family 16 n=1 Tax=Herpetosiphon aurantiacus (strain ATCC 23779 / DSM 785 / 114-95) TaxID=316274 RepID=A9AVN4_HERA2|nr:glycoside hydrolase family 16 protein [Herpetosiphon sp.]ABX06634.1 glycoside hydrolase family 16 [Herpetosiphon aurantiacus DSM 785]HBW49299.1 glycoside hydrolase [Herpetosiphon sp.]
MDFTAALPANPLEKPGYRLDFQDEFATEQLDQAKWLPYYLPQWSSRERSTPRYHLANQRLILEIQADQAPWCPEFDAQTRCSSLQTGVFSGALGSPDGQHRFNQACVVRELQDSIRTYTPQYGYFEMRAKATIGPNNVVALWMIGFEDQPEYSGELAIMEIKGWNIGATGLKLGYGVHPWGDSQLTDEFFEDEVAIKVSDYHIYAAEWTPSQIDIYLDNRKLRTIQQSPNYPMQFMLGMYDLPLRQPTTAQYPQQFEIDYVRGYQPLHGY